MNRLFLYASGDLRVKEAAIQKKLSSTPVYAHIFLNLVSKEKSNSPSNVC